MKKKAFKISRRGIALMLALIVVAGFLFMIPSQAAEDTSALGQIVDYFSANGSTFTLNSKSRFFLASKPSDEVKNVVQLAQQQFAADKLPTASLIDIVYGNTNMLRDGDIFIKLEPDNTTIGDEGYILNVENYVTVTARDVRGLMYGLNMLQKHFRNAGGTTIKGFSSYDTPDTKERTVQLDCARKYLTVNYVCNFVKEIAWMGYNSLQLHLSEDGGFRADIWDENYYVDYNGDGVKYEPNNNFNWLCGSHVQTWVCDESSKGLPNYRNDPDANNHLTTEQLIQIFEVCKQYNIDVIPSFDSPAHMDYLNWKFEMHYLDKPDFTFDYDGKTYAASATNGCINYSGRRIADRSSSYFSTGPEWPYFTTMDIRDDTTRGQMSQAFVKSIYEDMADFFKEFAGSTKFVIGADEVNLVNSAIYTTCWDYDLLPGYINEINAILEGKGYTSRVFNDFFNADAMAELDDDIQILYWNTPYNTTTGKDSAYTVNYDPYWGYDSTAGKYKVLYTSDPMVTVAQHVKDNRIIYNCVNLHTYYVLRVAPIASWGLTIANSAGDARSATNKNWEFYKADEESIYNLWTPNNIRKNTGVSSTTEGDRIVPEANFGGAYFLTWNDYAAVNTENEIWNGVYDAIKKTGEFYSLRERMWSNTIKMWNWDVNSSVNFATYETLRDSMGDFPALESNSEIFPTTSRYANASSLPNAEEPIALADRTELSAELATKVSQGDYSHRTYSVYEAAYDYALALFNDNRSTPEQLGNALSELVAARKALKLRTNSFFVDLKTNINGQDYIIKSTEYEAFVTESNFNLYIPFMHGYRFLRVEGATFTPSPSGDGSGYLSAPAVSDATYTLWYENEADISRLQDLVHDAIPEQGKFTHASWTVYTTALRNAQNFQLTVQTRQEDVDAIVKALEDARTGLVIPSDVTTITAERVNNSFLEDRQIGLHIKTTADVPNLTVTNTATGEIVTLNVCSGEVQTLNSGEVVKYWVVFFDAGEPGTYTYSISYHNTSEEITVTVC